ncbi:MAG: 50S ribosomal protein L6 [Chloroflexi bacterium]|nr:50S ribosomal protein L6 [Chloroflexota bacterium]MDA1218007.1 50S ribosomal protein L6 [Chloroflexota bacterium]PKB57326.1 MAG: 50S ribosomal protein L6 [SAR202 cluster bacterium Casp-Chloro-G3]
MSGSAFVREDLAERTQSRVGRKPIPVPSGVEVQILWNGVTVKGPKGTLTQTYHPEVKVRLADGQILVERMSDRKFHRSLHGLTRSLIANAITGVTDGYNKTMELMGVGYRVQQTGDGITLSVGYSHTVGIPPLEGVTLRVEGNNRVHVSGIDKQKVGAQAAQIRKVRRPNVYKEKGIRYAGEVLRYKPGKSAARKA